MSAGTDLADTPVDDAPETTAPARNDTGEAESDEQSASSSRPTVNWNRLLAFGVLPAVALILAAAAGFFKWQDSAVYLTQAAAGESVRAASDSTVAILSYRPETVERELPAAAERLTGSFRDQYTQLINDVVIPGAKQQHIAATATVPAAASVSAAPDHAVTLVLVDQTTTIGNGPPTKTTSSVRVTLDRVDGRWLVSQFEPV
jgi:Mce-associated membrane protein